MMCLTSDVVVFRCVSSKILLVRFKFARVKAIVVVVFDLTEGFDEKRKRKGFLIVFGRKWVHIEGS